MAGFVPKFAIAAAAAMTAASVNAQTANTAILDIQDRATVGGQSPIVSYNQVPPEIAHAGPRTRDGQAPTAYPYTRGVTESNIGPGHIVGSNIRDWQGAPGPFGTFQGRRPPIGNAANPTDPLWRYYDRGVDALGDAIGVGQTRTWQRFAGTGRLNALTNGRMQQSFNIHCAGLSEEQINYQVQRMYATGETTNCAKQIDNMGRVQAQRGRNLWNGIQRDVWYGTGLGRAIPQILPR